MIDRTTRTVGAGGRLFSVEPGRGRRRRGTAIPWDAAVPATVRATLLAVPPLLAAMLLVSAAPIRAQDQGAAPQLFLTADRCLACHNQLETPSGEDVSIGQDWRASMMANAARDPYWQGTVRAEVLDHPQAREAIEDKCSTCHMPMARYESAAAGGRGNVFGHLATASAAAAATAAPPPRATGLAMDGVSCALCHQIEPEGLSTDISFTGGFLVDEWRPLGERVVYGPFQVDRGLATVMRSSARMEPTQATHLRRSQLCASCHTLYTHALNEDGEEVGELPEQVPYLEWLHSDYRDERSCQDCHMPEVDEETAVSAVLGRPRENVSRHSFRGANAFMIELLKENAARQNVTAPPRTMDAAVQRTLNHLREKSAILSLEARTREDGRLGLDVTVENTAGHKLPTAYPSRRVWLHVTVRDGRGATVFESGAYAPDGRILGNDNDADAARYEPHYGVIDEPDQVQIYEAILVDAEDRVTTGLLFGTRYVKDNRLPPHGFDKATADPDIAVRGGAARDADFDDGGDRITYLVDVDGAAGPFTAEVELVYQSIAYRWAHNLSRHQAPEIERFVDMYRAAADRSAIVLATARSMVP